MVEVEVGDERRCVHAAIASRRVSLGSVLPLALHRRDDLPRIDELLASGVVDLPRWDSIGNTRSLGLGWDRSVAVRVARAIVVRCTGAAIGDARVVFAELVLRTIAA
jgi:hypothetical protein